MLKKMLLTELSSVEEFFNRSTSTLKEEDSSFSPQEGMLSVSHQVAHAAQSIDWFVDGMTNPEGFDMNFEVHWKDVLPCTSLTEARAWFKKAITRAKETVERMEEAELQEPLPEGLVMGGAPKMSVIGGISDHTAHHRGALTVYARLLGHEPKMPYMDV